MAQPNARSLLPAAFAPKVLRNRLIALFHQPVFWVITILGHSCILAGTAAIYLLERDVNPLLHTPLDTLFWSIATVTTVGYGNAAPMTTAGKGVGILMMMLGSIFLCSYTAMFAGALVAPELEAVGKEVTELEKDFRHVDREVRLDAETIELLRRDIESLRQELKAKNNS